MFLIANVMETAKPTNLLTVLPIHAKICAINHPMHTQMLAWQRASNIKLPTLIDPATSHLRRTPHQNTTPRCDFAGEPNYMLANSLSRCHLASGGGMESGW